MVANISPGESIPTPITLTLRLGSKGQNSNFSEHGHVAYQIKGNHEMQQHGSKYFARRHPPQPKTLGDGKKVKIQPFQNMVVLHIKLMKFTNAATW